MEQKQDPRKLLLSYREKVAYGLGDFGSNILLNVATLYLLKFYTDILELPGTYGGIIFFIAKIFTAFTDVGTGVMLDSRRSIGKRGKFRPFILYASFPLAFLTVANFIDTGFSLTGKTVVATIFFMLYGMFFSIANCPYGAMLPSITKNPAERVALAAWRHGGATMGLLICTVGFIPLLELFSDNKQIAYLFAAGVFALLGLLSLLGCYSGVKERYVDVRRAPTEQKKNGLKSFNALVGNRPWFILCIVNLLTLTAFVIKLVIQVYYTEYVLNDPFLLSSMGFFSIGCVFIGVFCMPLAVRRFGKKSVYLFGLSFWLVGDIFNYFTGDNVVCFILFSCLAFFGSAFVNSLNWAMLPDTVEYGEWRTGIRAEGTVYTGFSFFRKVSQALAGFFPGWMLSQIGYVPNITQSAETVEGLRQMMFMYPSILILTTILIMAIFYSLSEKKYNEILQELEQRKRQEEE